jgi:cystathionine gamma-synthase
MTKRDPATILAAARPDTDPGLHGIAPPLWTSDTFRWPTAEDKPDYDYSRTVNPNRDMLCDILAELEGAAGGAITGSGQSAALLALLLLPGDAHVVAPHDCYGGTYRLLRGLEEQGRLSATFVDMTDIDALGSALERETALVWIETPSNPLLRVTDIARVAGLATAAGALSIADNTLSTPLRQRPLELGCDLVLHSTTKAINGHGDLFGGALLARSPALVDKLHWWANAAGLHAGARDAWETLRGARTLPPRLNQAEASARRIAEWLDARPEVDIVHYPGLVSHPDHELATRQQNGPGFMLSFRVKGGDAAASRFLSGLELITLAASLGGHSTLICKPASMTHRGMPPEAQAAAGIAPDLLRLSIGIEAADDLIADLAKGFAKLG